MRTGVGGRGPQAGLGPLLAVLAGAGVAWGGLSYVALTIGVLEEGYRYTLSMAALLATFELAAMAAAALSAGRLLRRHSVRRLALTGALLAGAANIGTALLRDPFMVGVLRVLAGIGFGWLAAGLNTSMSLAPDPQRLFIRANLGCIVTAALFFAGMPLIYEHTSFAGYFVAYGVLCCGCAVTTAWLPQAAAAVATAVRGAAAHPGTRHVVLAAVSLVWLCYAAVWSLIERFGRDLGMAEEAVGRSLSLGTLSGLVGAGAAAWFAGRIRPLRPLVATSLATGLCYGWLAYCRTPPEYTWLLCVWGVVFCPILAYAYAVGSEVDPSGALNRLIAAGTAITTALGPVAGAQGAALIGYRGVGGVACVLSVLACGALAWPARPAPPVTSHEPSQGSGSTT